MTSAFFWNDSKSRDLSLEIQPEFWTFKIPFWILMDILSLIFLARPSPNTSSTVHLRSVSTVSWRESPTGWRRLIGSPKLQIIFHKRATKYRSLSRKMTYKDKGSYEFSPLCNMSLCSLSLSLCSHLTRESLQFPKSLDTGVPLESLDTKVS